MKKFIILLALLTITSYAYTTTINIPTDYSTIQAGIDAAADYDTVLVEPGTYSENINFNGKNITLASLYFTTQDTSYISQTIIDVSHNGSVVTFENGEDSTAFLVGFTLQKGNSDYGGGISCDESSPSLENLVIKNNVASSDGGGISCKNNSNPILKNIIITNNTADDFGGGIYCYDSSPTITNSIVSHNTGYDGISAFDDSDPLITYSDFYNNEDGNFHVCGNLLGVNSTTNANGDSCDVYDNIQLKPCFVDTANGNYHLTVNSPCIDAGDPDSPLDPDGTIADMGAYYYNQGQAVDDEPEYITQNSFISYPNPITAKSNDINIIFSLKKPSKVNIKLYNIKGQLVTQILNDNKPSGTHSITSNINNLASGIYFIKMDVDGKNRAVKKMVNIE